MKTLANLRALLPRAKAMATTLQLILVIAWISTVTVFAAAGDLDTTFDPGTGVDAKVFATTVQLDGKIIIGGQFTTYNGTARTRIARANTDGSLDTTFNPGTGANNTVRVTTLQADGKLVLGGDFTTYNGTARNRIARLNTDGSLDATFDPGTGANTGNMNAIAVQSDGKIMIGGTFSSFNGVSRNGIARLNADGSVDLTFDPGTGVAGSLNAMVLQSDGKIVIGGLFSSYNRTARNNIARINTNGSLDLTFDPGIGPGNSVVAMALQSDGRPIIGGSFITYNGITRDHLARVNTDGSLDTSFDPGTGTTPFSPLAIAEQTDGNIVIAGDFTTYNGTARNRIARVNTDGSLDTSFDPGTGANTIVLATTLQPDANIIIGGNFTTYDGTTRTRIARVESGNSTIWKLNPGSGDWNTGTNWTTGLVPNGPADTATFAISNTTSVVISTLTEVNGVVFNPGASAFTITARQASFTLSGVGLINDSAMMQNFVMTSNGAFEGGILYFFNSATAGASTTLTNSGGVVNGGIGGQTYFFDSSSAGAAILVVKGGTGGGLGGAIYFEDDSTGGAARVELSGNGTLDISELHSPGLTVGSIESIGKGTGIVALGDRTLTVGVNNLSTLFAGLITNQGISNGVGYLTKVGSGTLTLSGANIYTGTTTVSEGTLLVAANRNGFGTGFGPVQVDAATLGGNGAIAGAVTVGTGSGPGAFLSPGINNTGTLTISMGSLTFKSDATYISQLNSDRGTADKVVAKGVTINSGALFSFTDLGSTTLTPGTVFTVIDNTEITPIAGVFSNLPEGLVFTIGVNTYKASYRGGAHSGRNNLILTVL